jgi:WD40 repeat protein
MTPTIVCRCGHRWSPPEETGSGPALRCPACGAESGGLTIDYVPADPALPGTRPTAGLRGRPPGAAAPVVPGYEVLEELGHGGMGVVYRALQAGLNRAVALKVLRSGPFADPDELARFRREAAAAARLRHPNIIQVFEIGEHDGRPYFSLELAEGGSLSQKLGGRPLPPRTAAQLVEVLSRAVHAAHLAGIVHRDLKPSNVLLTPGDGPEAVPLGEGAAAGRFEVKVADFGLAKRLGEAGGTVSGAVMGTPSYMAPEQADGRTREAGPAADVYALGVILYELLTGRPPFQASGPVETLLLLRTQEPVAPSRLQPKMPRDLETVCLKCLEKDPARRYASAELLAGDLRRFLDGRPIQARPVGSVERLARWCRRNPLPAILGAAVVLALAGGVVVASSFAYQAGRRAREAGHNLELARAEQANTEVQRQRALKGERDAQDKADLAERRLALVQRGLFTLQLTRAAGLWESDPPAARALLDDPVACPEELRDFAWRLLRRQARREIRTLQGHQQRLCAAALSPDGRLLATASLDGALKLWDLGADQEPATLPAPQAPLRQLAFAPDGKTLVGIARLPANPPKMEVRLWDVGRRQETLTVTLPGRPGAVALSAGLLACGGADGAVRLWDVATGKERGPLCGPAAVLSAVRFLPGGTLLAARGDDGVLRVWDHAAGKEVASHAGVGPLFDVSADGRLLAALEPNGLIRVRDLPGGAERAVLKGQRSELAVLRFSPDGKTLAGATVPFRKNERHHQETKLWDVATGLERFTLDDAGQPLVFSPDGRSLATASAQGISLWDVPTGRRRAWYQKEAPPLIPAIDPELWLAFTPDSRALVTAFGKGVTVWSTAPGLERAALGGHVGSPPLLCSLGFAPDGRTLLSAVRDQRNMGAPGQLILWDVASGKQRHAVRATGQWALFSPDGKTLASGSEPWSSPDVCLRDLDGQPREVVPGKGNRAACAAFAPDGRTLAIGSLDGQVRLLDLEAGHRQQQLSEGGAVVGTLTYSADGRFLAAARRPQGVTVWEMSSGAVWLSVPGGGPGLAFSADGLLAVGAEQEGRPVIRLWDTATGAERQPLTGLRRPVRGLGFSPDGRTLAAVGGAPDGPAKGELGLWDVRTGRPRAAPQELPARASVVVFSPDGRTLLTGGADRAARLWDPFTGQERLALTGHEEEVTHAAFSAEGHFLATGSRDARIKLWDARPLPP